MSLKPSLFAVLACLFAAPAYADEVDDALRDLEKAVAKKDKTDIKHFVTILGDKIKGAKPEQQKAFFTLMKKTIVFPDKEVKEVAIESLGKVGDARGFELLQAEFDRQKDDVPMQQKCIAAIGQLKDVKVGWPFLKKLFNHKSDDVVASSIDALSNYRDAELAVRKDLVSEMLKIYSGITSAGEKPKAQTSDKAKLEKTRGSFENSLKALSGVSDRTGFDQWWKWWGDVGKKAEKW